MRAGEGDRERETATATERGGREDHCCCETWTKNISLWWTKSRRAGSSQGLLGGRILAGGIPEESTAEGGHNGHPH